MRKITINNKRVIARNASLVGGSTRVVKAGSFFVTDDGRFCRSLGRIASCDDDVGPDAKGWVVAMVLGSNAAFCFERWIDPDTIQECYAEPPAKMTAFFFSPALPYDAQTMRRLMDHGTTQDQFIDNHQERVAMFAKRDRLAQS